MFKNYIKFFMLNLLSLLVIAGCSTPVIKNDNSVVIKKKSIRVVDYNLKVLPTYRGEEIEDYDFKISNVIESNYKKNNKAKKQYLISELFLKAADASFRGDAKFASMFYKYLVKLKPKDKSLKKKFAIELIRSGQIQESLSLIESIVYPKLKDESLALVLGGVYTALGKKIKARKIYKKIWAKFKTVDSCVFLGKNLIRDKKERRGLATLKSCSQRIKSPEFDYLIGQFYIKSKKFTLAKKYFLKSLIIDSSFDKAAMSFGLILESKEKYKEAILFYKQFLKKNKNSYSINSRLVQLMFVNSYGKQIIPYAQRLVSLDPDDLNTKVKLGILYTDNNNFKKAKGVFKEILAAAPKSDKVLYYIAALSQQTGDVDEALEYFNKIEPESGLYLDSNIQISKILKKLAIKEREDKKKTTFYFDRFVAFTKKQKKALPKIELNLVISLVTFYEDVNMLQEAVAELELIQDNSKFKEEQQFYLASLYDKLKDHNNADIIIKNILENNPDNADALNFLGYSYLERSIEPVLALKYLNAAHKLKPKSGYILDSLGWYHYKNGDFEKALSLVKLAWKYAKSDMVIAKHLALIYEKFKDYSLAKQYYTEALKNCSNLKEKKQIILSMDQLEKLRLPASE